MMTPFNPAIYSQTMPGQTMYPVIFLMFWENLVELLRPTFLLLISRYWTKITKLVTMKSIGWRWWVWAKIITSIKNHTSSKWWTRKTPLLRSLKFIQISKTGLVSLPGTTDRWFISMIIDRTYFIKVSSVETFYFSTLVSTEPGRSSWQKSPARISVKMSKRQNCRVTPKRTLRLNNGNL